MSLISAKRFQQGVFQSVAGMNKAAATGSGSGFQVMQLLTDTSTGSINQTFTGIGQGNAVDVTNSSSSFQLPRASRVFINAQMSFANNAGNTDYAYVYLDVDGAQTGMDVFSGTAWQPYSATITAVPLLGIGNHTTKLRVYVGGAGNTGIIYKAEIITLALGA